MRRSLLAGGVCAAVLLSFGASAGAQKRLSASGARFSVYEARATFTGQLSVRFHGATSAGCARRGVCGYRGSITLRPDSSADFLLVQSRRFGRRVQQAFLASNPESSGPGVASHVVRYAGSTRAGLCADAGQSSFQLTASSRGGRLAFALLQHGGTVLETRCAGPLDGDVADASPRAAVSFSQLTHQNTRMSFTSTHTFAAHGFAGTVSSTIVVRIRKLRRQRSAMPSRGSSKTKRLRIVRESLSIVGTAGRLSTRFAGTPNPTVCQLLDSCGVAGVVSWEPLPTHASGELVAVGPASLPYRDFLAALGLRHGPAHGITVLGTLGGADSDLVTERMSHSGTCTDSAHVGSSELEIGVRKGGGTAGYLPIAPIRTRCPGPLIGQGFHALAVTRFPRAKLAQHRFTLVLHAGTPLHDDGYTGRVAGQVTLTVRRGAPTTHQTTSTGTFVSFGSQ
jgi:hypothetical protein